MAGTSVSHEHLKRYGAAILLVGGAVMVAAPARLMFDGRVPQGVFTIAVLIAAAYGGLVPGLLATGLSTAAIGWLFRGDVVTVLQFRPSLVSFASLCVLISFVMEQFRRSRRALERSKMRVEQANAELSRRSEALALSNEELRRFAYALSHDLQNPLRTVSVFAEHLAIHNNGALDETSAQSLRFIIEGVARMQEMIRALLDYSTVVHDQTVSDEQANCGAVLRSVMEDLREAIMESGARISFDSLPVVAAGSAPVHQLLMNMLSNAIKYRGPAAPEVHISARRNGNEWIFSVRDNGIGLDMQYAQKIFGLFERLHGASKYSGSGIGLAICRAIVQRYGGRIWVDSQLGHGSTFFFTLPCEGFRAKHVAKIGKIAER